MEKLELTLEQRQQVLAGGRHIVPTPEQRESILRALANEEAADEDNLDLARSIPVPSWEDVKRQRIDAILRRVEQVERETKELHRELDALKGAT